MFGWTRQHYVIAAELRHARTSRNLAQSRAISRNLPPPPEGTIVRQGLHMSGCSPGKNGDGVIVRLATLTQWAVSAMLNTGRIHIFMRIIYHAPHTRARQSLASAESFRMNQTAESTRAAPPTGFLCPTPAAQQLLLAWCAARVNSRAGCGQQLSAEGQLGTARTATAKWWDRGHGSPRILF